MAAKNPPTHINRVQLRTVQIIFIFINLVLVETHLPGVLWVVIGGVFWITMILLAAVGGSWMCGWICWVGSIQDFMEPFARSRVRLNAKWGRGLVLLLLVLWVPVVWWFMPEVKASVHAPFGINPDTWTRHLFQLGLMIMVALSVMVLGKRGICRYLCPFNQVVRVVRKGLPDAIFNKPKSNTSHPVGCTHCTSTCHTQATTVTEMKVVSNSFVVESDIRLIQKNKYT